MVYRRSLDGADAERSSQTHCARGDDKIDDFLAILALLLDALALKNFQQVSFIGFDPRTEALIKDSKGNECKVSKGMPPVIFQLASITEADLVKAQKIVSDHASKGYRTLAATRTHESGRWVMLGIVPRFEPLPSSE